MAPDSFGKKRFKPFGQQDLAVAFVQVLRPPFNSPQKLPCVSSQQAGCSCCGSCLKATNESSNQLGYLQTAVACQRSCGPYRLANGSHNDRYNSEGSHCYHALYGQFSNPECIDICHICKAWMRRFFRVDAASTPEAGWDASTAQLADAF